MRRWPRSAVCLVSSGSGPTSQSWSCCENRRMRIDALRSTSRVSRPICARIPSSWMNGEPKRVFSHRFLAAAAFIRQEVDDLLNALEKMDEERDEFDRRLLDAAAWADLK